MTDADIAEQERLFKEQIGSPNTASARSSCRSASHRAREDAQKFADTVIQQFRAGAPFPVVAAQFSQSQTALQGGDLGWVRAQSSSTRRCCGSSARCRWAPISNPIRVPGGISIVTLRGKREIGRDNATIAAHPPGVLPFTSQARPGEPDRAAEAGARAGAAGCRRPPRPATRWTRPTRRRAAANRPTPARSGWRRSPRRRCARLLTSLPELKPSQPLVAEDGIAVIMVCSREQKNRRHPRRGGTRRQDR